ncbi:unnamed protein product [Bursaphelenchus okinawaensis]|uniref:PKD/REJ-like domain-containing protein n=1 Tax=Bursaphelenchus okinawaensis TaxID=465554 RepID=A0A811LP62_9BILA|nr:unnamed protein product [Bursaphelenchus okinawaensis]CAG9126040.1 unnamed protein product [Bursaphelenchus okinawaensis]
MFVYCAIFLFCSSALACYINNEITTRSSFYRRLTNTTCITYEDLLRDVTDDSNYNIVIIRLPSTDRTWYLDNNKINFNSAQNDNIFSSLLSQNGYRNLETANITANVIILKQNSILTLQDGEMPSDEYILYTITEDEDDELVTEDTKEDSDVVVCVIKKMTLFRREFGTESDSDTTLLVIDRDKQCFNVTVRNTTSITSYKTCHIETENTTIPMEIAQNNFTNLQGCYTFDHNSNATLYCDQDVITQVYITSFKQLVTRNLPEQLNITHPILKILISLDFLPKNIFPNSSAFCSVDGSTNVPATIQDNYCACNFSNFNTTGKHSIYVVRSSELYDATMKYQHPVLVDFSTLLETSSLYVTIHGIPRNPLARSRIVLYPGITVNISHDEFFDSVKYKWYTDSKLEASTQSLTIKGGTYRSGQVVKVTLIVTATYDGNVMNGTASAEITYIVEPLVAVTDSYQRSVSQGDVLFLDASDSYNPNYRSSVLQHSWQCVDVKNDKECQLDDSTVLNKSYVSVDASYLVPGQKLMFVDYIRDDKLNSSVSTVVTVQPRDAPTVKLLPFTQVHVNFMDSIRTQAYVRSFGGHLETEWHLYELESNKSIELGDNFPYRKRSFDDITAKQYTLLSFTLPSQSHQLLNLSCSKSYVIRLLAMNSAGIGWADRVLSPTYVPQDLQVRILPEGEIYALETAVTVELANSLIHFFNFYIRFGIRTVMYGNKTSERWNRFSAFTQYSTYLPSTMHLTNGTSSEGVSTTTLSTESFEKTSEPSESASEEASECNNRVAYQGLVELCDFDGYCIRDETSQFTVLPSRNLEVAYDNMMKMMEGDLQAGAPFSAFDKLMAVSLENCTDTVQNVEIFDTLASRVIRQVSSSSDLLELMEGLQYLNNVMLRASERTVARMSSLSYKVKNMLGFETKRSKRSADLMSAMAFGSGSRISEDMADELLRAYDLLISKNQQSETLYLGNVDDLLGAFCVQTDSNNIMSASGGKYTDIQLQALLPSYETFLNSSYNLAGTDGDTISFNVNFKQQYSEWKCSNGNVSCSEICLGSGQIKSSIFNDNEFMRLAFANPGSITMSLDDLVSDIHRILFMDPINGAEVALDSFIKYTVNIPLTDYSSAIYYKCLLFTDSWNGDYCTSSEYAINTADYGYLLQCNCSANGYVGVFKVSAPTPYSYPYYNELLLQFSMSSNKTCTLEQATLVVSSLATVIAVQDTRFVNVTACDEDGIFEATLRPALNANQTANSYVVQAVVKAVYQPGGFVTSNNVVDNVTVSVVQRATNNDGNARRLSLRIEKTLKEIAPKNSDVLAGNWVQTMATNMKISQFRFKNAVLLIGCLFNFTITLPFPGELSEVTDMSAEEISLIIQEQVTYDELQLYDKDGQVLSADVISNMDVYQLVVAQQLNTLVVVLGVLITVFCTLGAIFTGGLVFVKVRTDNLIQAHNREFDEHFNQNPTSGEHQDTVVFK